MKTYNVVSRSSRLAIIQTEEIINSISGFYFNIIPIQSIGDKNKQISLMDIVPNDFFTRELDEYVLTGKADFAVHSAKDLAYPLAEGLELIALTAAKSKADVLVSIGNKKLSELPIGAKVGTSSPMRKSSILTLRGDLEIVSIRGSIDERLALLDEGKIDALIVAQCALERLDLSYRIAEMLPFETHPLQGNLAIVAKIGNAELKSVFHEIDIRKTFGKVFITGFGPGNPELLTIKALNAIRQADIIFMDDLIDKNFLNQFSCEKVFVGKRKDAHSKTQDEINNLLYTAALDGKRVVRLKGGDPQLFGRGSEEFDYLRERFINVEIIPGISSAFAAAASVGIPLTLRGESGSVAFCTGYPINKVSVPSADTLVYYMSASTLKDIAQKVLDTGRDGHTPVALIQDASAKHQRVIYTTLHELLTTEFNISSPLITIIGTTVKNKNLQSQYDNSNNLLITGTSTDRYEHLGDITHTPMIEIESLPSYTIYKDFFDTTKPYDWIIFTSRHTIQHFIRALIENGKDLRWLANSKIMAIGQITARELTKCGLKADIVTENESSEGIVDYFVENKPAGSRIIIPRSNIAADTIPNFLKRLNYTVDTVVVYNNTMPKYIHKVDLKDIDIIVFASPSEVRNFKALYSDIPDHIKVLSRGKVTESALYEAGFLKSEYDWVI